MACIKVLFRHLGKQSQDFDRGRGTTWASPQSRFQLQQTITGKKGIYSQHHRQKEIAPSLPILCFLSVMVCSSDTGKHRFMNVRSKIPPSCAWIMISQTHGNQFNMTGSKLMLTLRLFLTFIVILLFKLQKSRCLHLQEDILLLLQLLFCRTLLISLFQIHWKFPQALYLGGFRYFVCDLKKK